MNKDDMNDDAEFDAFLKGEGALSRRLQAMPQPEPGADLDAAILARARLAMAEEVRPPAANDPGSAPATPKLAPSFGQRWKIPMGIAATVLAGVFAGRSFAPVQQESVVILSTDMAIDVPAAQLPPPAAAAAASAMAAREESSRARVGEDRQRMAAERKAVPMAEIAPPPPPPSPASPVAAAAAPAPVPAPAPPPALEEPAALERAPAARAAAAPHKASRAADDDSAPDSKAWLARIERLLADGRTDDVRQQWKQFKEVYPDLDVAPQLRARLDALEQDAAAQ